MKKELINELLTVYNNDQKINDYHNAIDLLYKKKYINSRELLKKLGDFRDSKKILDKIDSMSLLELLGNFNKGDEITFGNYYGPIEWYVLQKDEESALLLSKYGLERKQYNERGGFSISWEYSTIRKWLNDDFLHLAFSEKEIALIKETYLKTSVNPSNNTNHGNITTDKIFLLSKNEFYNLLSKDVKLCKSTKHLAEQISNGIIQACGWWLQDGGHYAGTALYVDRDGGVNDDGHLYGKIVTDFLGNVCRSDDAVRPALYLNLKS